MVAARWEDSPTTTARAGALQFKQKRYLFGYGTSQLSLRCFEQFEPPRVYRRLESVSLVITGLKKKVSELHGVSASMACART